MSFPVLTGKVIYNGVHAGDHLTATEAEQLLKEVEAVLLPSSMALQDFEREFFVAVKSLCEASTTTKNPIVF